MNNLSKGSVVTSQMKKFAALNLAVAIILILYCPSNPYIVQGVNSMLKPIKFAISQAIFMYTMGWILSYMAHETKAIRYKNFSIAVLSFELLSITIQALRGVPSHFNNHSFSGAILAGLMGLAIVALMCHTLYIGYIFYIQTEIFINPVMKLSIIMAIPIFFFFAMEGGLMAYRLSHTVGGPDNGPGLPLLNWSVNHGDLRIAHFMGIHSLQLIPFVGYIISKTGLKIVVQKYCCIAFSIVYLGLSLFLLYSSLIGQPVSQL